MCEELNLIQTALGIWNFGDWSIDISSIQLNKSQTCHGIYLMFCKENGKMLIGEGKLGGTGCRLKRHFSSSDGVRKTNNTKQFNKDLQKYSKDAFFLWGIIPEKDEIKRKLIENKLQIHFGEKCYNRPRKLYPTQKELLEDKGLTFNKLTNRYNTIKSGNILQRLNNYTKVQKVEGFNECWESKCCLNTKAYAKLRFKRELLHHVLMYILHYGDICGITSEIHHKCKNKKCVNPNHLELVTHSKNVQLHFSYKRKNEFITSSKYNGVCYINNSYYTAAIKTKQFTANLGRYNNDIEAAQNRDYYIVKNNLWAMKKSMLNFHNIDYNNFIPHNMANGKLNKYFYP